MGRSWRSRLFSAAYKGSVRKVKKVLEKYGNEASVDSLDDEGRTCLDIAAQWGHLSLVDFLLEHGATIDKQSSKTGATALHTAVLFNHPEVVQTLLRHGARSDIFDKEGISPQMLLDAAFNQRQAFMTNLKDLEQGIHDNSQDDRVYAKEADTPRARVVDDEREFNKRLWEEMDHDDSVVYDFEEEGRSSARMTDEEWRQWIAKQMYRKRKQADTPTFHTSRRSTIEAERKAATEQANRRSQRILKEEREKEVARKAAVQKERFKMLRQSYEERWANFTSANHTGLFETHDLPWPCERQADLEPVLLFGVQSGTEEYRMRIRNETRRWHPDKWPDSMFKPEHAELIKKRVVQISQTLNNLKMSE